MGTIVKVSMQNFLSHKNFEITFDRVNGIFGQNGSGKSAVFAAIIIALGGRASATGRGPNLQSLIKYEANSAQVTIKLKNGPNKSYKKELYGEYITICRILKSTGSSSYKIKNERGNIVSIKPDEVVKICAAFNIQVENPISMLNQHEAQVFQEASPDVKFKYFRKATNLDVIKSNHENALGNCIDAKKTLQLKKEAFKVQEKELLDLKEKYDEVQTHDEVQEKIKILQNEYYWSEIKELESEKNSISESCAKQKRKIENFESKIQNYEEIRNKSKADIEAIENELSTISESRKTNNSSFKQVHADYENIKTKWKSCQQQVSKKKEQINKEDLKAKDLEKEVRSAKSINFEDEKESLEIKKNALQNQLAELNARRDTMKNEISQVRNAAIQSQNQHDKLMRDRQNLDFSKKNLISQLNELSVRGKNNLAVFGDKMIDLVNSINQNKRKFSQMPRGPIGSYLKVHDKKWSGTLESIIGQNLMSFCVNNNQDSRTLFQLMTHIYGKDSKPTIITSPFIETVHNVSKNAVRAPQGYFSALDALKIDDPVVANALIDSVGLESILLVSEHDEAINFAANINNVPQNCKKILTLDASEYFPMPNYRSYGGRGLPSRYIQVSSSERKMQLENELKTKEKKIVEFESEIKKLNETVKKYNSQETDLDKKSRIFESKIHSLQVNLSETENNIKSLEYGHIKVLNEELKSTISNISQLRNEETEMSTEELRLKTKLKEMEASLNNLKASKSKLDDKLLSLREELSQNQLKHERNESDKRKTQEFLNSEKKKLSSLVEQLKEFEEEIQEKVNKALELCPRIESPGDKKKITEEIKKKQLKLRSLNTSGMTKQEILEQLVIKNKQYTETLESLDQMSIIIEKMKKLVQQHLHQGMQLEKMIGSRVQYFFQSILNIRGYSGIIEIDYGKGTLHVSCTGKDSTNIECVKNTDNLSGGETTFATVALLTSLWDCMEVPFYFLDEFDLYMDKTNQVVTMSLLMSHVTKNVYKQLVLLTPNENLFFCVNFSQIKVYMLAKPIRSIVAESSTE